RRRSTCSPAKPIPGTETGSSITSSSKAQKSAIDYNVFEGKEVTGLPRYKLTRGVVAIEENTIKTHEGHGEFVRREPVTA
ncbi:hypothetical protein ACC686_36790, partial [Rhizobium johnstonii]